MDNVDRIGDEAARVLAIPSVPHILDIVCRSTGMGFAAIARVTPGRWIACAALDHVRFGLKSGDELQVETTICHEVRNCDQRIVIDDVAADARWREHRTPRMYGFRSYVSVPIRLGDGSFFGTLCAIDPQPRRLDEPRTIALFESFAELLGREIDGLEALDQSRAALSEERETGRQREEFLAMLGHDLRTPLASIMSGVRMLRSGRAGDRADEIIELMQGSLERMDSMVETLLDLARASLAHGIPVEIEPCAALGAALAQVVDEARAASGREIVSTLDIAGPVACDPDRLCQLAANLIDNAVAHGAPDTPVRVEAARADGTFRLSVANAGQPIPPEVRDSLFRPFFRGRRHGNGHGHGHDNGRPSGQGGAKGDGLGLGLYIAAQIARAHGGTLSVASDDTETRFTFEMPLA